MHRFSLGGHARMIRRVLVACTLATFGLSLAGTRAFAQSPDESYKAKRDQLTKELDKTQKDLADVKSQREQLEARLERVMAETMQQRAQALLLTNEQTTLQQLDALLSTSETNLMAQRDRFSTLTEAVNGRSGATLVVLLRADSSAQPQTIQSAVVSIDNVAGQPHTYSAQASGALAKGAVDQVYRAPVVPSDHAVSIRVSVGGQTLTGSARVAAPKQSVTYVQFAVRNGQLTSTSWTGRGNGPF